MDEPNMQEWLNPTVRWLVFFDLEATCSDKDSAIQIGKGEGEAIELGAVAVDLAGQAKPRGFRTFAKPIANPILTECCIGLTGIAQHQVDVAPSFPQACAALAEFLAPLNEQADGWAWMSWGDSDLSVLDATAARYGIAHPLPADRHHNLKGSFAALRGEGEGIGPAMERLTIRPHGTPHRALSDACNLARVWPVIRRYGIAQAAAAERWGIDRARAWMRENNAELGGRRPAIVLHNDNELAQVLAVIEPESAMEYTP